MCQLDFRSKLPCVLCLPFSQTFFRLLVKYKNRAARVVIDEVHQVLTAATYRDGFHKISRFGGNPLQKIYLTASAPVRLRQELLLAIGASAETIIIEGCVDQPNLSYQVIHYKQGKIQPVTLAANLAKLLTTEILGSGRLGMIFSKSKEEAASVAEKLNCCFSHSGMDKNVREANEEGWLKGNCQWIASTTGLIHGIDAPNVGCVIFIGDAYGMINIYQGAGRAGRDGIEAMIVVIDAIAPMKEPKDACDLECAVEAGEWIRNESDCLRIGFSKLFSAKETTCSDPCFKGKAYLCGNCDPNSGIRQKMIALVQDKQGNKNTLLKIQQIGTSEGNKNIPDFLNVSTFPKPANYVSMPRALDQAQFSEIQKCKMQRARNLNRMAEYLKGYCVVCWASNDALKSRGHRMFIDCYSSSGYVPYAFGWINFKKETFSFPKFTYCFSCGFPQEPDLRPKSHAPVEDIGKICGFQDFVVLLVWYIKHKEEVWKGAMNQFSALKSDMSLDEYSTWCSKTTGSGCFYNGLELVLWFWVVFKEKGLV